MDSTKIDELIYARLTGKLSGKESSKLDSWLAESDENGVLFDKIKIYWADSNVSKNALREKVWNGLYEKIREDSTRRKTKRFNLVPWAAAIATVLVSSVLVYSYFLAQEKPVNHQVAIEYLEKTNPPGFKSTMKLPDGSTVKLNADSRLKIPNNFNSETREVFLEGEAFFDIAKNEARPFIIHTGNIQTTVKGTSFNVNAYPETGQVAVAVVSGIVEVSNVDKASKVITLTLTPNEMASFNKSSSELKKSFDYDKNILAWKDDKLVFSGAQFNDIILTLERWYGVTFEIKKKVEMKKGFRGEYESETLKNILETVSYTGNFSFKIEGKKVTIY
ncbi:MAG: FecR domain-containing protein [Cyclobacteriaceae bacterium]